MVPCTCLFSVPGLRAADGLSGLLEVGGLEKGLGVIVTFRCRLTTNTNGPDVGLVVIELFPPGNSLSGTLLHSDAGHG